MKGLGDIFKQAQEMQSQMQALQAEIQALEVTGESGAGLVRVVMSGGHDVRRVQIDPAVASEDTEVLEDLVAAAVNDAVRRVEAAQAEKMATLTAGLNLPPGFKLPF